jgi:hypothetical protein
MIGQVTAAALAVGLAVGLTAMAGWERAPWGLAGRLASAEASSDRKSTALLEAARALRAAGDAIRDRDRIITENAAQETQDAGRVASFWKGQARAAFDAGYAARRCDAAAPAGGVRDLRTLWEAGRFTAGPGDLPGEPDGGDRRRAAAADGD